MDIDPATIKEWSNGVYLTLTTIGTIAVVLTIRYIRKVVRVSCFFEQPIPLVSVRREARDKIKIYYEDKLIEDLNLIKAKIRNTGNVPIRKEHIEKPIEFDFGEAKVIDFSVISKSPDEIEVDLEMENENKIKCMTGLLNPKDEFILNFVYIGNPIIPKVSARIEGLKKIEIFLPEEGKVGLPLEFMPLPLVSIEFWIYLYKKLKQVIKNF